MSEDEKLQLCLERDRLLCDLEFARSPIMSKLLRFLVEYKLREVDKPLTAYVIAVDALGRDDGFDTQIDSYPRVQIGRLRRMLDHFYLRENSEMRLSIPYNHYEIVLGPNEPAGVNQTLHGKADSGVAEATTEVIASGRKRTAFLDRLLNFASDHIGPVLATVVLIILLALGALFYLQQSAKAEVTSIAYPEIIVRGPEGVTNPAKRTQVQMTRSYLVSALEKFDQLRIFDGDADTQSGSQYLLETSVLYPLNDRIQLRLIDRDTGEVIWSDGVNAQSNEALEADLDRSVVIVASPHGKIAQHELAKFRGDYSPGYPCLLQFHQFMRYRDESLLKPNLECMEASAEQFPDDPYLMSMMVIAKNVSEQFGDRHAIDGLSKDFALKAAQLDHDSAVATFAVAQSAFYEGDCRKGVAWGERAVRLNPLNSRIMGYLGLYMLACNLPEGEAYSVRALELDPYADLVVAATLAMQKLQRGDAMGARQLSSKYLDSAPGAAPGLEISYILSTAALGDKAEAQRAWRSLIARSGLPKTATPRDVLSRWIANPVLIRELEQDFENANLD